MKLILTTAEKMNPLWLKLDAYLNDRLDSLRKQNDGDLDDGKTANLRGRIAEIKSFLDIATDRPKID